MKKSFFLFLAAAAVALCSCGKEGQGQPQPQPDPKPEGNDGAFVIKAVVAKEEESTAGITHVKATVSNQDRKIVAVSPYVGKAFSLELPEELPADMLKTVYSCLDFPENSSIVVSNPEAKCNDISIQGFPDASLDYDFDNYLGDYFCKSDVANYRVRYYWFDRDVDIKGSATNNEVIHTMDIEAKKGWNPVYYFYNWEAKTYGYFSKKPAGNEFNWVFMGQE